MTSVNTGKPVVAVVVDAYTDYQRVIVGHLAESLNAAGVGLLCVVGRDLDPVYRSSQTAYRSGNAIYPLARQYDVCGYIFLSATVGQKVPVEQFADFVGEFDHRPVVSLGIDLPGVPSVVIDNFHSMNLLMEHMTRDPVRQRFVFIRGLAGSADSIQRERVFRSALTSKNIPVDEELIIDGNFIMSDSFNALDELLCRTQSVDAVVAANDIMAASAIRALRKHNLSVPEDVIVSGFDDSEVSREASPPVTTVRQPWDDQARVAVSALLEQIASGVDSATVNAPTNIASKLVIRTSSNPLMDAARRSDDDTSQNAITFDPQSFRRSILDSLVAQRPPQDLEPVGLVDDLVGMLVYGSTVFLETLKTELSPSRFKPEDIHWWRGFHHQMGMLLRLGGYVGVSPQALPLMCSALTQVHEAVWSIQTKIQFDKSMRQQMQDRMQLLLASSSDLNGILHLLTPAFSRCGVKRAYMVLYEHPGPVPGELARLVYAYPHSRDAHLYADSFASTDVLPAELAHELDTGLMILMPLYAGDVHFGYLIMDPSNLASVNIESMAHSVSNAVRHCVQIQDLESHTEELSKANSELAQMANYDSLTGLPNRTLFQQNLETALIDARHADTDVALLFFDLDGFKVINDTLGHSAGDYLLRIVAKRLKSTLRKSDMVSRLGGDEFTVILAGVRSAALSAQVAQNLLETLSRPYKLGNRMVNVSASIGIAHYPVDGEDAETLVKHADTAMYHAKSRGKDCYSYYTSDLNSRAVAQLRLDQAMREGLANGEFSMFYQPRFDLDTHELKAFEALMRWHPADPSLEPKDVSPDVFIALAEQTGFIAQLDTFALDQACQQARRWEQQGYPTTVAVNLSVKQLQQNAIVDLIDSTIKKYGLNPKYLELEITESAAMSDVQSNIEKLSSLRKLGLQISIDDFGTAYSSLNYLKKLPVTSLKIDKSFLREIRTADGGGSADAAIIKAVVALGRSMDFKLIAEGIETVEQRDFLRTLGCDEAQGYLFSRPLNVLAATELLRKNHQSSKVV